MGPPMSAPPGTPVLAYPPAPGPGRRPPRRHRAVLVVLGVLVALAGGVVAVVRYETRPGWHVVWRDEFDGRSVQASHWNVRNDSWAPNEESIDTNRPTNVQVADGALRLIARREQYTAGGTTRQYTSGYLDTIGKRSWKYGRFEMRAKLPPSIGLWPAFWLRTDKGPGEIDVMEAVGGDSRRTVQTVHQSTEGGQGKVGHEDDLPVGSTADWHTYSVELAPAKITWSIDDRVVLTVRAVDAPWIEAAFDQPVNIRLNLQVGGAFPAYYGRPVGPATVFPAQYVIDWIRVYQYG